MSSKKHQKIYSTFDVLLLPPVITQRMLAENMKLHYNTIYKRHRKLRLLLPDYKKTTEASKHLTRYQCWCQFHYHRLALSFQADQKLVVKYFKDRNYEFSLYKFNQEINWRTAQ